MQRRTAARGMGAVLFTDIVGSTAIAAEMGNTRWAELVTRHHRVLRRQIGRFGGREIDTAGDGFFIAFERPADAIRCAVAATEAVRELGIEIRAGVSFGELEMMGRKPGGLVVNTAARVMSVGGPGEVLVPASVREIVPGAGITFAEHGVHRLKGLEGEFRLFSVTGVDGADVTPPLEVEQAAERRREIFPTRSKRGALIAGLGAAAVALSVSAWLLWDGEAEEPRNVPERLQNAVVSIDVETGTIGTRVPVGRTGNRFLNALEFLDHPMVVGEGGVWLMAPPRLLHIDPLHADVRSEGIEIGLATTQTVAAGFDAIWVLSDRTVSRVHPGTDELRPFLVLPLPSGIATYSLVLDDLIWLGDSDGTIVRMDPATGARDQAETGLSLSRLATTRDGVWVADVLDDVVVRVDRESLRPTGEQFGIGGSIDQMVGLGDDLWILDNHVGTVTRVDGAAGVVRDSARVGHEPTDMAVTSEAVWIADRDGSLYRVDATTLEVREFPIGAEVLAVDVDEAEAALWVYVGKPTGAVD
ncbi:MAG: adenylate/guanylate cyclase domain-containing protein [Actinomycetota bacterium]